MDAEYRNYLEKHKTEPFIMLDEMDLDYEQFKDLFNKSFTFRKMWAMDCDFTYYEIRAGKCQHSKIIHGKIICEINCGSNY
jgi:hypothetical protein